MEYFVFLLFVALAGIVLAVIVMVKKSRTKKAMSAELKNLPNFSVTQEVIGEDANTGFAFDETLNRICLINGYGSFIETRIMEYSDILSVELFEDGVSMTKTSRGSQLGGALLGGVVFGPLGAVIGGLSGSKKSEDKVKRLDLRMAVNDTANPVHDVNFLNIEVKKSSMIYKAARNNAGHWSAIIEALIKRADSEDEKQESTSSPKAGEFEMINKLRELANLRDEGLLTNEEFAEQKSKLLSSDI